MKASEFRKLIREEVRRALKEAAGKAYALVIDEDGNFVQEDLASYSQDEYDRTLAAWRSVCFADYTEYRNTVRPWENNKEAHNG